MEVTVNKRLRFLRPALRVLAALALVLVAYLIISPTGRYLLRAGYEEGKILSRRTPITEIVAASSRSGACPCPLTVYASKVG